MYKVLAPLPGYAYCIGDETKFIKEADAEQFLKENKIEIIQAKKPAASDKKPVAGK